MGAKDLFGGYRRDPFYRVGLFGDNIVGIYNLLVLHQIESALTPLLTAAGIDAPRLIDLSRKDGLIPEETAELDRLLEEVARRVQSLIVKTPSGWQEEYQIDGRTVLVDDYVGELRLVQ